MTDEVILREDKGAIRRLTLNRPAKLNAMNDALVDGLVAAVDAAHRDDSVQVVILAGNARAFSAGADLTEAQARRGDDSAAARAHAVAHAGIYRLGARTDKPLIAAVRGYALGGGFNLALACDLVVAGTSAVFGYPELKRGLAATMVTPGLVHRAGEKAAFELLMLAENVSAERALALGLINCVVPDEEVLAEAERLAEVLLGHDAGAIRTTKRVFLKARELGLDEALDAAREAGLLTREIGR